MKKLLCCCLISVLFITCKKENETQTSPVKYLSFVFGTNYNYCVSNCARLFLLAEEKIYPGVTNRLTTPFQFSNTPLSNDKYLLTKELTEKFPNYLLEHPNSTIGCPDCTDQGTIIIEMMHSGVKQSWQIDTDLTKLPAEIRSYVSRLMEIHRQLF